MVPLTFGQLWSLQLWGVMRVTGKGYKRGKMTRTGVSDDRRADKVESAKRGQTKALRSYQARYA